MATRSEPSGSWRGLSVRQLTLIFLGAVGVCAMFFALGYLVGANGRPANNGLTAEQVPPPSEIPPTVNPPAQSSPLPEPETSPGSQPSVIEQDIKPTAVPTHSSAAPEAKTTPQSVRTTLQPSIPPTPTRGLMIQVAASHTEADASQLVKTLRAQGYHSVLITPQEAGMHDHIYRVQVGPYGSRPLALAAMRKLNQKGFHPFIKE